ncbi:hypothetical protein DXT35_11165 [Enterococcus faecalis]|uniref:hypothetical protein n=1 Tax=Enterococcus faecalis TaxID=1351 RepID=UPI00066618F5|nr:hypothetical protein [Enterococcus faecalis]EGO8363309.1 hypothetical protein [Enterococcus faecalis]EGO8372391.1 hypothetical protein [Enterococcus faecalis]EGO8409030.1 hypothetical protein [Enterococcus faecalis]EGO8603318.1 hypothetical protein [Enterococcus faecalis]EGO8644967.1 hypothetical protein [Enterococcus faecalis]
MFFNFWRISAYFRRGCFCSRRLSVFERGTKIQSDFCPTLLFLFFQWRFLFENCQIDFSVLR